MGITKPKVDKADSGNEKTRSPLELDAPIKELLLNFGIVLGGIMLMILAFIFMELRSAITLLLLVGTWLFDGYIKYTYSFKNETLFADFSFGAFAFSGGQGISVLSSSSSIANSSLTWLMIITIALGFLWFGNLSICRYLVKQPLGTSRSKSSLARQRRIAWLMSLFLAMLSCVGALFPQLGGIV